jgi:single-stranded-DNA-specific exonuclease
MNKEWQVRDKAPQDFFDQFSDMHPLLIQLLYNRGLQNQSNLDIFFKPDYEKLHDPFLFADMKKAVERVWQAISKNEKIIVHGDYDADGVTSAATIFRTLRCLGANVEVFIPHRELDGYGINPNTAQKFVEQGCDLLITVDCGITNGDEVEKLNQAGVDTVITDHHEPPEVLPKAVAILDPKVEGCGYPFAGLSGAAVAYKLVQGLLTDETRVQRHAGNCFLEYGGTAGYLKWILDVVAIGVVADVMPLVDENRILVKWGLIVLQKTRNVGLQKLLEFINTKNKIDTYTIGFQLAPRLNAAGRMNHAIVAFNLLVEDDPAKAGELANELHQNNLARQKITEKAVSEAREQFLTEQKNAFMLFAFSENWEPGIIGLIAGRLSDEFYRPVLAMTTTGEVIVGSGRSVEGFNITQGLNVAKDLLARFGGHSQACGFTIAKKESLSEFQQQMGEHAKMELANRELIPGIDIDAEINYSELSWELLGEIERFEPFGEGNRKPIFVVKNIQIVALDRLGSDGQHLRFLVRQDTPALFKMLLFGKAEKWIDKISVGDTIEAVCEVGKNEWNGKQEIEFKIVDLRTK